MSTTLVDVKYGTVEIESRFVPTKDGGLSGESRKIERNRDGAVTSTSAWEPTGVEVTWPDDPPPAGSWWKRWTTL